MSANFDLLELLFTRVVGRPPKTAQVSDSAVRKTMKGLRAEVLERVGEAADVFRVPAVYLTFWQRFGGEKALTDKVTTLYAPEQLRTSSSHLIFGLHHAAKDYFGLDHFVLEDDDPDTMHVKTKKLQNEYEDDDFDPSDVWEDFTVSLTYGLLAIASENLLRALKRRVLLRDCNTKPFRTLLASMESLYGTDVSEVTVPTLIYFSRGILLSHWDQTNEAEIGFDTEEREQAFLDKFPQAQRIKGKQGE